MFMHCSGASCKVVLSSEETANLCQTAHPHTHSQSDGQKIGLQLILKLVCSFPIGGGNHRKKAKQTNTSWLIQPSSPKSSWWVSSELRVAHSKVVVRNKSVCCRSREDSTGSRRKNEQKEKSGGDVRVKGKTGNRREKWDSKVRSEWALTGRQGEAEKAIMRANRESIIALTWQNWETNVEIKGDKMSWEQMWWESEGRNEGESERRQETLMFGGVNHWACRRKRRAVLEWQVCWAKTLIMLAVLPRRRQSVGSMRGEGRRSANANCSGPALKWPTYSWSSTSFPWVNIYDNHKGKSSVIAKSHLSLRRFTCAAIFIVTMLSITCVSIIKWPFCCCLCNKIHVANTLIWMMLHWKTLFPA